MPIRILHIMGGMHRGGVETCLMQFLRKIDKNRFQIDILVHTNQCCDYDQEIEKMGIPIIACPYTSRPLIYAVKFLHILKKFGPYDIIHSHVHHYSGFILRLARLGGVSRVIVHSHSDTLGMDRQVGVWRKFYLALMKSWIKKFAAAGLACSREAGRALYGETWGHDPRWQILYCGIDLEPFKADLEDKSLLRDRLHIPAGAFVIGHVGRFTEAKNHEFLLRVFVEVLSRDPRTCLLLIGDGPLLGEIKARAAELGVADKVIFTGAVSNVPAILRNAIDLFLFPSLYEGLPLALLEAQAAGLPCLISDAISEEAIVIKPQVRRLPLSAPVPTWVEAALELRNNSNKISSPQQALSLMENSPFNINCGVHLLEQIYETVWKGNN